MTRTTLTCTGTWPTEHEDDRLEREVLRAWPELELSRERFDVGLLNDPRQLVNHDFRCALREGSDCHEPAVPVLPVSRLKHRRDELEGHR